MTWLPIDKNSSNERDAVLGLHPDVYQHHQAFLETCSNAIDAELLELCRARMAQTLNCREELARHSSEKLAELDSFNSSVSFTNYQKNVLEFVDQFLLDPGMISPELAASLESEMGASGVINFSAVISAFEASLRLSALFDLEPTR